MEERTRNEEPVQSSTSGEVRESLDERLRSWVRGAIETLLQEELKATLQAARYQREADGERRGYRHATRDRMLATSVGPTAVTVPRARLFDATGVPAQEWQSAVLPRYQRRTRAIDQSLVGAYLSRREYATDSWGLGAAPEAGAAVEERCEPCAPVAA